MKRVLLYNFINLFYASSCFSVEGTNVLKNSDDFFIAGLLFVLGLLNVGRFLQRKEEKGELFLGLFTLVLCLSWALASKNHFFIMKDMTKRFEYIGLAICPLLFVCYLNQVFLNNFEKAIKVFKYLACFFTIIILFIPAGLLGSPIFFSLILLSSGAVFLYMMVNLLFLSYQKSNIARIIFLGSILVLITIFVDDQSIKGFPTLSPWFISIFLFLQSQILTYKWNKKFKDMTVLLGNNERTIAIQEKVMDGNKREMNVLLDNIRQGIFTVDEELTILSPISKYCESLFKPNIAGVSVFEILFKNMKMTGQTYKNLYFTLKDMFLSDRMQFWAIEDKLPHKVDIFSPDGQERRVYKVAYSPICDRE